MFRKRHLLIFFHEITGVLNGVFIFYSSFPSVQTKQFLFGHLEMIFFTVFFLNTHYIIPCLFCQTYFPTLLPVLTLLYFIYQIL